MKNIMLLVASIIVISGCATPGVNTHTYTKHVPKPITNEIQVDQPYFQVWDKLVRELSKSFYVINNIDKESRIINISFSSQSPSEFVDCGQTHRSYKKGNETKNYDYNVADSATFIQAMGAQEALSFYGVVKRTASLDGRSNIYLAPQENDKGKTTVAVNTRYILNIDATVDVYAEHINGSIFNRGQLPRPQTTIISFNTNNPKDHDFADGTIATCFSNGKLEQDVLQILQK